MELQPQDIKAFESEKPEGSNISSYLRFFPWCQFF